MMNRRRTLWLGQITLVTTLLLSAVARAEDSAALRAMFADPPRQYSSGPLWVWNDMLTEEQIVQTLHDLADQKVKQAFVHPRPGLMTPYLSDDWFRLWKTALDEAERLDMNLWIYDENSYPSGFAGGFVPKALPDSRAKSLRFREEKQLGPLDASVVAVYRLQDGKYENITATARSGQKLPEADYLVAAIHLGGSSAWYANTWYVDLLKPGVTEKFLEVTLEPYRKHFADQFGQRIPGVFTDEPRLTNEGGIPWSEGLPAAFEKRWGYSLLDHLPSMMRPVGDWQRVRHNYMQVLLEQFIEHWSKPYHDYCVKNHLEFTGHYWEHDWPELTSVPDNMAMYAWHQRPAIDCLMNQYKEDTHAQFGNVRMVKELSSVANQLGMPRTLCEAYGAGGWDLRFEDMKRIADWLMVLGVNTLDEHLSYITLRGARKMDHPQSFSYHEPWWPAYHVMAQYDTRLSAALSQGRQVNPVLVLEPTTTAWLYQYHGKPREELDAWGNQFCEFLMSLERAQAEYDLGCEDILARHGSVDGKQLVIGQRRYGLVVLPANTENLNGETAALLEKFLQAGGHVLACGAPPSRIDGEVSERGAALAQARGWQKVDAASVPGLLSRLSAPALAVQRAEGDAGILFHHRRQFDDGQLVFLVNSSLEKPAAGTFDAAGGSVEQWDLMSGETQPYAFEATERGVRGRFELPPSGSLLLFVAQQKQPAAEAVATQATAVPSSEPVEVRRLEPNVLTLDYVDLSAGGQTKKGLYFYDAQRMAFAANGTERNPWDSAVQFGDELIRQKYPATSGFEATYHFTIDGAVPGDLEIVLERPDLYTITCNGKPVSVKPDAWWLDRSFGRIDLAALAQSGENSVTLRAQPFTIYHELEPAYLRGSFRLRPADAGFVLTADKPLELGVWNAQGHPMYSAGVAYSQTFEIGEPAGRYQVRVPNWYGSVAQVVVNGKEAGYLVAPPWQCDVSAALHPGKNTIEVVVLGTLKNTLGPFHTGPLRGSAWPGSFHQGPDAQPAGDKYDTIGYGMVEPFVLEALK